MTELATIICIVLALLTASVGGIQALRNRPVSWLALRLAGATEVAVLFYTGVRVTDLAEGHQTAGLAIVLAYLIGLVLAMPITTALSWVEPSRWGSVTLAAGALVTCVLFSRINQLWVPYG